MNDKDSKVPIYIAIIIALVLVAGAGFYVLGGQEGTEPDGPGETPVETEPGTPAATPQPTTPPQVTTIKCELCHDTPILAKDLKPHVEGGKLCINCHGSQVHNIHIGTGTVNLQCDSCHGFPPKIPTVEQGQGPGHFSICEQCHAAPPDNLKPSLGNLVVIHLSRGKYCTNCHGTDVGDIHKAALGNASK